MLALFSTRKENELKNIENKLYRLVDRKEKKIQSIDDQGRDLVLFVREYLGNTNDRNSNYRSVLKEVKRYIRENQHYA